jgi:hypothetical protein
MIDDQIFTQTKEQQKFDQYHIVDTNIKINYTGQNNSPILFKADEKEILYKYNLFCINIARSNEILG